MSNLVRMFLPDGSIRERKQRPFVPLPHGTALLWNGCWYTVIFGDRYIPINLSDVPKSARVWCLIKGINP